MCTLIEQILHHTTGEMIVYQVLHAKRKLKNMLGLPRVGLLTVYCIAIFLTEICTSHKIDRPKVLSTSQIFEAHRGTTVTLPCTFNNLGTRSVIWLKGNQHSSKGAEVVMELRKNRQGKLRVFEVYQPDIDSGKLFAEGTSLVIQDLRGSDQDIYTCTLPSVPEESITHSLTVHESQDCRPSQFRCDGICVEPCDGIPECIDGSDETTQLCTNLACRREDSLAGLFGDNPALQKFRCKYGGCIAGSFKCNGRSHCWDGSDELDDLCASTTCKRRDVKCDYGGCIRGLWECDGKTDCRDGSDETLERCKNKACPSRRPFKCAYGACIEERKKCDKKADCADDSDETKELCGSDHTFTARTSSIVDIPKAETNPQTQPPPTQPPPTRPPPTQPPPTQPPPPTPPPPPSDPCRASSLCSCPGSGICVPCDRLDSCSSLLDGPKCSLPSDDIDTGITVDVLACGSQAFVNVAVFSRNHEALCSSKEVPTETVVMADCWGTATILAQCRKDGKWHPYGNSLKYNTMEPSTELCQPRSINSLNRTTEHTTAELLDEIRSLRREVAEIKTIKQEVQRLSTGLDDAYKIISQHQLFLEEFDNKERCRNLVMTGLSEDHDETGATDNEKVHHVVQTLGYSHISEVGSWDIKRLGQPDDRKKRPILIIVEEQQSRNDIISLAKNLKALIGPLSSVYIKKDVHHALRKASACLQKQEGEEEKP